MGRPLGPRAITGDECVCPRRASGPFVLETMRASYAAGESRAVWGGRNMRHASVNLYEPHRQDVGAAVGSADGTIVD